MNLNTNGIDIQINPQHSVPTLDDNGAIIWDSHAICTYLIGKYGPNDALYPKEFVQRAKIDQRLHFDSGVLYPASRAANVSIFGGAKDVPTHQIEAIVSAYKTLETFFQGNKYLVGNNITVADFCCAATVTTMEIHVPIESTSYPKTRQWLDSISQLPYFEELNTKPVKQFQSFIVQKKTLINDTDKLDDQL